MADDRVSIASLLKKMELFSGCTDDEIIRLASRFTPVSLDPFRRLFSGRDAEENFYIVGQGHGGKPWMTAFDNPFVQAAGRAIEAGFGQRPVFNREGGSIPVVSTFQEELGVPCVLFGVGLPDENAHAPDEKLDLGNFHNGVIASAYLYREIGQLR